MGDLRCLFETVRTLKMYNCTSRIERISVVFTQDPMTEGLKKIQNFSQQIKTKSNPGFLDFLEIWKFSSLKHYSCTRVYLTTLFFTIRIVHSSPTIQSLNCHCVWGKKLSFKTMESLISVHYMFSLVLHYLHTRQYNIAFIFSF